LSLRRSDPLSWRFGGQASTSKPPPLNQEVPVYRTFGVTGSVSMVGDVVRGLSAGVVVTGVVEDGFEGETVTHQSLVEEQRPGCGRSVSRSARWRTC